MSTKLEYYGKVTKEGEISLPKRMRTEIIEYFSGKSIELVVKQKRKYRSSPQNAYYWSVVIPYVLRGFRDLGHQELVEGSAECSNMIHELMKQRFLYNGITLEDSKGNVYDLPSSTTRCSTTEFMDYLDRVVRFAAECLNVNIPAPSEQLEIF